MCTWAYSYIYTICASNYSMPVSLCVTFQELLLCEVQSLSCQAQPWVFPPPFLFHLSTEEALWGFGVAAVWFRSFQHQASNPSPMHPEVYSVESSTYSLHCPTQYCFRWQGQPASLSVSQPSVSICVYWIGLACAWLYTSCFTLNERHPHLHTLGICFTPSYAAPYLYSYDTVYRCVCVCAHVCLAERFVFVVGAEHKNKVLIKSNSVNLSNGCNQLPQCALSRPANGCSAICYVDRYTHASQEKWISGNKDPLFPPSLPSLPYDVNGPYIPLSYAPGSCQSRTDLQTCHYISPCQTPSYLLRWCVCTSECPALKCLSLYNQWPGTLHLSYYVLFLRCCTAACPAPTCTPNRATTSSVCLTCPVTMTSCWVRLRTLSRPPPSRMLLTSATCSP